MSYKLKSVVAFFKFWQTKYISPHQKEKKNGLSDANSRFREEEVREEAKYNVHDESTRLGLLPTCAGVLREIIPTRIFNRILANHTSEESLITADYDKNII